MEVCSTSTPELLILLLMAVKQNPMFTDGDSHHDHVSSDEGRGVFRDLQCFNCAHGLNKQESVWLQAVPNVSHRVSAV